MVVSIRIEGIESTQRLFNKMGSKFKKDVVGALQESGMLLQEEIQASIEGGRAEPRSVDTGEFLSSIISTNTNTGAIVSSDVPQALFMEFGTTRIPERRHFRNSLDRLKEVIVKRVEDTATQDLQ
jgi:hypothetical protein